MVVIGAAIVAVSCERGPRGPSEEQLRNRFALTLPGYVQLSSFGVQVQENIANDVEPVFKTRFVAKVRVTEDMFREERREAGVILIRRSAKSGAEYSLYGVATSVPHAGGWQVDSVLEDNPIARLGGPREIFSGRTVVLGTDEESALREEIARAARIEEERIEAKRSRINSILKRAAEAARTGDTLSEIFVLELGPGETSPIFDTSSGSYAVAWKELDGLTGLHCEFRGECFATDARAPWQRKDQLNWYFKGGGKGTRLELTVFVNR